jgi:hypothetical protein
MDRLEANACDQHVVLDASGPISRRIEKGQTTRGDEMTLTFEYNSVTNVMFIDLCAVQSGDKVEVVEVGECLGFPGQIQARVNRDKEVFYGLTIQNYSGLKRKLQWQYRMFSIQSALRLLVLTLLAGLRIDQSSHRPALCR